ncbi:MAG TPA: flagellar brake protein [Gammaproteobacteria bacterium]|nr:flagellar brake protein [Gammaproteobacteria bacterium]
MTDKQEQSTINDTDQSKVDNYEKYLLNSKAAIVQKLRQLAKSKNNLTAHFGGGKYSMLTQIVDVLPDKDLVVLDYGSNEATNKKLLQSEHTVFKTQHEGVTAQFSTGFLQKAKLHGKPAFACPIPESLLWVQRREFYRVRIPLRDNIFCELIHNEDILVPYSVLDISIAGLAIRIEDSKYTIEAGMLFNGARLILPNEESGLVNIEIMNYLPLKQNNPEAGLRFGCQFHNISTDISAKIQRYIYDIELMNRQTKD